MEHFYNIFQVIQVLLIVWLGYCAVLLASLAAAGLFFKQKNVVKARRALPKIALLIPAYKENEVIYNTAVAALKQDYENYDVVVIADSINSEVLKSLKSLDVIVQEVSFVKSTKSKALNETMSRLPDVYQLAVILDADNIMSQGVLSTLAQKYADGYNAIQGHRTAMNQETGFSMLDAISEEMNNHIYCKGTQSLGLTSRLTGSGMGFDYQLFKRLMKNIDAVGGFDKVLELELIESGNPIHYIESAKVYDEKVSQANVFSNQRTRWVSAQFYYFKKYFFGALMKLFRGKVDYFIKASHLVFPPRMLFPVMVLMLFVLSLLFSTSVFTIIWSVLFALVVFSYSVSIPKKLWTKQLLMAFISLPKALLVMLLAMFKLKDSNKNFIHTPHSTLGKVPSSYENDDSINL